MVFIQCIQPGRKVVRFELESGQPLVWKRDLHKAGEVVCQLGKADLGIQRDGTANGHQADVAWASSSGASDTSTSNGPKS